MFDASSNPEAWSMTSLQGPLAAPAFPQVLTPAVPQ
jgi:hypothetical protein